MTCSGKWSLPVMLIMDLSLARVVQHSPFQFYAFAYTVQARVVSQTVRAYARDDHYLRRSNLTLSSLK